MRIKDRSGYFFCCLLLLAIAGCSATGGDIVKISSVSENVSEPRLKAADRAMLEEIQKNSSETRKRRKTEGRTALRMPNLRKYFRRGIPNSLSNLWDVKKQVPKNRLTVD